MSMSKIQSFQLFGFTHMITIGIILMMGLLFASIARIERCQNWIKPVSWALAIILLGNELIFLGGAIKLKLWSYEWGLPLQICDLAILAVAYSLIRYNQFIWEMAYFWGLGGTMQAILTPDIQASFPDYIYFKFFITHGCIIVGVIFLALGCRRQINLRSIWRVWLATNIYGLFIMMFNAVFHTNYLYLAAKPVQRSIIDYLGPWPYYIIGLEIVLILSLFLYYLPYYFFRKAD